MSDVPTKSGSPEDHPPAARAETAVALRHAPPPVRRVESRPPPLPPAAATAAAPEPDGRDGPESPSVHGPGRVRRAARAASPWFISAVFHQVVFVVLAFWVVSGLISGDDRWGVLLLTDDRGAEDEPLVEPLVPVDVTVSQTLPLVADAALDAPVDMTALAAIERMDLSTRELTDLRALADGDLERAGSEAEGVALGSGNTLRDAATIEEAMGGVIGDILDRLDRGDLLVAWLIDESISQLDDRPRVAAQMEDLFRQVESRSGGSGKILTSTLVGFGSGVRELVGPTRHGGRIVAAVPDVPVDPSGIENVMAAVQWCAARYRKRAGQQVMIVVWTDESGDDVAKLEATIAMLCQANVTVSILGPSAMLGNDAGTHVWTPPGTGLFLPLPVKRGPDSALPERLWIPFWYPKRGIDQLQQVAVRLFEGDDQGGGPPREIDALPGRSIDPRETLDTLSSGFGPYALTRLALANGGSYTIFDRPRDRGPFRLETMRPYMPDYRPAAEILDDLKYHPLRQAVLAAAAISVGAGLREPPPTRFFEDRVGLPLYYPPAAFRNHLKDTLQIEGARGAHAMAAIEKALACFGPEGMEREYEAEPSARWRAWYDVTRGRLLALRVRYLEYGELARQLPGMLHPTANYVALEPLGELRLEEVVEPSATEAERLLRRAVESHAQTPWAALAERELKHPLGFGVYQREIPRPPPPAGLRPSGPTITAPRL